MVRAFSKSPKVLIREILPIGEAGRRLESPALDPGNAATAAGQGLSVALANKIARTIWALLVSGGIYYHQPPAAMLKS